MKTLDHKECFIKQGIIQLRGTEAESKDQNTRPGRKGLKRFTHMTICAIPSHIVPMLDVLPQLHPGVP